MTPTFAIAIGCMLVGILCIGGAITQVWTGRTWGATGKGRVYRRDEPGYFWGMFVARIVLGPIAWIGGMVGLAHA